MDSFKLSLGLWLLYLVFPVGLWLIVFIKFISERSK